MGPTPTRSSRRGVDIMYGRCDIMLTAISHLGLFVRLCDSSRRPFPHQQPHHRRPLTCPPSRHDDVVVTLLPLLPGAVNSTAHVLDLMQDDDDDDERYTPVTVTESPAATIPAEPSTAISGKVARSFRSFEDARAYVRTLGLKSFREWQAWRKSDARPHDIPSDPYTTYKTSGWLSLGDFLGYAGGKVTGAYKRNAAVAGLWALQKDADNDEEDEQDEDDEDEDARRRKQAKRPRGG